MGFASVAEYAAAIDSGHAHFCSLRKIPSQASTAGWWADLSMAAGNPPPNYYASSPLIAGTLEGFRGIFHGADKAPGEMFLTEMGLVTPTAGLIGRYMLLDYLLYYPFIDGDSADEQDLDNTVPLPRYADGDGVRVMAVAVAPSTGTGKFTFDYINQAGDAKTSPVQVCSTTAANIATLITTQQAVAGAPGGPFLLLADGDTGVRSITAVTMSVLNGGLFALVLVRPLADFVLREANTMTELPFVSARAGLPRVLDGAYLNLIVQCSASIAAGTLTGYAKFAWSD